MKKQTEVIVLDNGVVVFDAETRFLGGFSKAKHLREGGVLKMVSEARKRGLC